jgi:hypothetical protein
MIILLSQVKERYACASLPIFDRNGTTVCRRLLSVEGMKKELTLAKRVSWNGYSDSLPSKRGPYRIRRDPDIIMLPSFGLGFAGSRTPRPAQARLRTLMNHTAFGIGRYLSAVLVAWLSLA